MEREISSKCSSVKERVECWDENEPRLEHQLAVSQDLEETMSKLTLGARMCLPKAFSSPIQVVVPDMGTLVPSRRLISLVGESRSAQMIPVQAKATKMRYVPQAIPPAEESS